MKKGDWGNFRGWNTAKNGWNWSPTEVSAPEIDHLWASGEVVATVWKDGLWHSWSHDGLSQATGHAEDMEQAKMRVEEYRNHG